MRFKSEEKNPGKHVKDKLHGKKGGKKDSKRVAHNKENMLSQLVMFRSHTCAIAYLVARVCPSLSVYRACMYVYLDEAGRGAG